MYDCLFKKMKNENRVDRTFYKEKIKTLKTCLSIEKQALRLTKNQK